MELLGAVFLGAQIAIQIIGLLLLLLTFRLDQHWAWLSGAAGLFLMTLRRVTALVIELGIDFNVVSIGAVDRLVLPFTISLALLPVWIRLYIMSRRKELDVSGNSISTDITPGDGGNGGVGSIQGHHPQGGGGQAKDV